MRTNRRKQPDRSSSKHEYQSIKIEPVFRTVEVEPGTREQIIGKVAAELKAEFSKEIRKRVESRSHVFENDHEYQDFFNERCRIQKRDYFRELFLDDRCIATWYDAVEVAPVEQGKKVRITIGSGRG